MVIGVVTVEVRVSDADSLKAKRAVLQSLKQRVHDRFNVSMSEVDHQDLLQRARFGVAHVSTDRAHCNAVLSKVIDFLTDGRVVELIDYEMTFY